MKVKEIKPLEIYKEYCRYFIQGTDELQEWLSDVESVFIQQSFLYVALGKDLYQYKVYQGSHKTPYLTLVEITSGNF
jgi:hypothetical protein